MKSYFYFVIYYYCIIFSMQKFLSNYCDCSEESQAIKQTLEMIKSRGFGGEVHRIITDDGYILNVFRLTNPRLVNKRKLKPVLLQHGIMSSVYYWIYKSNGTLNSDGQYVEHHYGANVAYSELNGVKVPIGDTLPYVLSQFGYDVWIGNFRGNKYSAKHCSKSDRDSMYWSFTLDQLIDYDLTAMINHITNKTKSDTRIVPFLPKDTIAYIGHSMGATTMLGLLSSKVEYNHVIKPFIALAPVVYFPKVFTLIAKIFMRILKARPGLLMDRNKWISWTLVVLCKALKKACGFIIGLVWGDNPNQIDYENLASVVKHFPEAVPKWIIAHFFQFAVTGKFQKYDYGSRKNRIIYGQTSPPDYDLQSITTKVALIYSYNDHLINRRSMARLRSDLRRSLLDDYLIEDPKWAHIDYHIAKDAGYFVNARIVDLLKIVDNSFKTPTNSLLSNKQFILT